MLMFSIFSWSCISYLMKCFHTPRRLHFSKQTLLVGICGQPSMTVLFCHLGWQLIHLLVSYWQVYFLFPLSLSLSHVIIFGALVFPFWWNKEIYELLRIHNDLNWKIRQLQWVSGFDRFLFSIFNFFTILWTFHTQPPPTSCTSAQH
jgi:hypothetical protein